MDVAILLTDLPLCSNMQPILLVLSNDCRSFVKRDYSALYNNISPVDTLDVVSVAMSSKGHWLRTRPCDHESRRGFATCERLVSTSDIFLHVR